MHKPILPPLRIPTRLCHVFATALVAVQLTACGTANNNDAPADKSLPDLARRFAPRTAP